MKNKYKNMKVVIDNIKFDSIKEARRYRELSFLLKVKKIKNLKLQPKYELQPKYKKNNKTIRAINYIADFEYIDENNNKIVEDVKGIKTEVYKLKKKIFEYKYNLEIKEI